MTKALVTPTVLTWARQRRGMPVMSLASKLNVKPQAVEAWETGEKNPTFRQAQRLAQALYVPFGYLYLDEAPVEELPIPDFRTMPGPSPERPSPDLLDLLNDVLGKQQWFREYRESEGIEELPFVGRFNLTDSEEEIAADIRGVIDVEGARASAPNFEAFLRQLTRNAERSGVMVLRSGVVGNNNHRPLDTEEFRGFAISDHIAPLIFINGRDFKGAQIFTFAHELAHIWSGQGGISNPNYSFAPGYEDSSVEWFCNRVAAETLVPGRDFQKRWIFDTSRIRTNLMNLSNYYKVSPMVILRQAHDQDFMPATEYRNYFNELVEQAGRAEPSGETGGNFYYTLTARNGTPFTTAVVSSAAEGALMSSEAADLLGVKVKALPGIAKHFFGSPLNLG